MGMRSRSIGCRIGIGDGCDLWHVWLGVESRPDDRRYGANAHLPRMTHVAALRVDKTTLETYEIPPAAGSSA